MRILMTVFFAAILLSGCADSARELYDTARFEELQNNKAHAVELYERVVSKHPGSDYAKKAAERLEAIRGGQSSAPADKR